MCFNIENISIKELITNIESSDISIGAGSISAIQCVFSCAILKNIINSEDLIEKEDFFDKNEILNELDNSKIKFLNISNSDKKILERLIEVFSHHETDINKVNKICYEAAIIPISLLNEIEKIMKLLEKIRSINIGPLKTELDYVNNNLLCAVKNAYHNIDINITCIKDKKMVEEIQNKLNNLKEFFSLYL